MNRKKIMALLLTSFIVTSSSMLTFATDKNVSGVSKVNGINEISSSEVLSEMKSNSEPVNLINNIFNKKIKTIGEEEATQIAKEVISKYFNTEITEEYKMNVYLNEYKNRNENRAYWNISWNLSTREKNIYIGVNINAYDGTINNISLNDYSDNQNSIADITFEEAKNIASEFLKEFNPKVFEQCELINNTWSANVSNPSTYNFEYVRIVNGQRFYGNSINITVDGVNGKVTNYNCNWNDEYKFPKVDNVIGHDKAVKVFENNLKLNMVYKTFRNKYEYEDADNKKNVKLVYENTFGSIIDAQTGLKPSWYNESNREIENIELNEKEKQVLYKSYKEIQKSEKAISKEEAYEIINKYISEIYGQGYEIDNLNYRDNQYDDKKIWSASFTKSTEVDIDKIKEKQKLSTDGELEAEIELYEEDSIKKEKLKKLMLNERGNITIDALTNQIITFNKHDYYEPYYYINDDEYDFKPELTYKEGYYKVIDLLKKYYPDKVKNINLMQKHYLPEQIVKVQPVEPAEILEVKENVMRKERYYNYTFNRVENGISYYDNQIRFTIDAKTGDIRSSNCVWYDDVVFESPKDAIGEESVTKILMSKYQPELFYSYQNISKSTESNMKMKLLYSMKGKKPLYNNNDIDAFTGKMLDYSGEELNDNIEEFLAEIKNSPYKKEIEILAYSGLIDTRDFKLDYEVRYMDLIKTIVDALGYRPYVVDADYAMAEDAAFNEKSVKEEVKADRGTNSLSPEEYLKMAKYYGILDEDLENFDAEKEVSREEMAKAFIKFLDYETIAECNNIFALNFEDASKVSKENTGYVALAYGLDLIKLEDNKFRPNDTSDYEEMCIALFNALMNKEKKRNILF